MKENMNFKSAPKLEKKKYTELNEEETKRAEFEVERWVENHPDEDIPMKMRRDWEKEKDENIARLTEFAGYHSLENLNNITELTPDFIALFGLDPSKEKEAEKIEATLATLSQEDVEIYRMRTAAKEGCIEILNFCKTLAKRTNISKAEYEEIKATYYKPLSRAVGIVNRDNKVDHTR
jgi:hypothetical protein